jgi:hypothetical protein
MKAIMTKTSLNLGAVHSPPLSHVKMLLDKLSFDACMRYLLCACANLVISDCGDVLYLAPLTTTHGEAVLPISMAQQGGLREVGARGEGSLGIKFSNLIDQACSHSGHH